MEDLCRICLAHSNNLIFLFSDKKLLSKIKIISNITILESANLPSSICAECYKNVNDFYAFRNKMLLNEKILQENCAELKNGSSLEPNQDFKVPCKKIERCNFHKLEVDVKIEDSELVKQENQNAYIQEIELLERNYCDSELEEDCKLQSDDLQIETIYIETVNDEKGIITDKAGVKLSESNNYKCKNCDFETADYGKLRNHAKSHKPKSMCNICGKYIRAENLSKHIKTHSNDVSVTCKECGKTFKNEESYRSHPFMHVREESICEKCGKQFEFKGEYLRHLRLHKEVKRRVICELCKKAFKDRKTLQKHSQTHTGIRPHPCEYCGKKFSSKWALKTHKRQHTNERPYKCELCPSAFTQKVSLRTHMSKHKDDINAVS